MYDPVDLLQQVSRTFALSIRFLPASIKDSLGLAYLLLRVSDGIEDCPDLLPERKVDLLHAWEQVLQGSASADRFVKRLEALNSDDPEIQVALHSDQMVRHLRSLPDTLSDMVTTHVAATTSGMARWQSQGPIVHTVAELDDYMFEVAGRVGYLVTEIFSWHSPAINRKKEVLLPLSKHCGLGLQTVNVIRGLRSDYERGWVFVPATFLDQVGISIEEFFSAKQEAKTIRVVDMLIHKAEHHLHYGLQYIQSIPKIPYRIRLACLWPLFFALSTLAVSRDNLDVVRSEVKITRETVKSIMRNTSLLGWSNRWLQHYYQQFTTSFMLQSGLDEFSPAYSALEDSSQEF